jgi:hypothetical protein
MKKIKKTHAAIVRESRLQDLIKACLDRYSEEEIVEAFRVVTENDYAIELGEDGMTTELSKMGYLIFKPMYGYQENQLREFAESVVFPYVNEQQCCIF